MRKAIFSGLASLASAQCPYAGHSKRAGGAQGVSSRDHVAKYDIHDDSGYLTSDVGGPIEDQNSLKAGDRGPTFLEDFIFRQKITHFDHERVPERAVHARGAGAYGTFTSYGDFSNVTAASFLASAGKKTPTFVRFSTVTGSRGSADTARDVHGFATRFYTDEGNFDIVGNNIPVFFIQDAILFQDLVHAVKPRPDNEIPQAATAHNSAWDFFSQETSALHTLFWAMAGYGIPRSFRHMNGFGVHTFRFVNNKGASKLIKWHWKTKQGKASLVWDETQHVAGKNADFHREDLWDAIESGNFPEWELCAQIIDENQAQAFKFDKLGVMRLDANPVNYFAETEQIMLPINRPVVAIRNNNRDGAAQNFIHSNVAAYSPNTLNHGFPLQANQTASKGLFTAPQRRISGSYGRTRSKTFADHWTQPRLFYNSLTKIKQQFLIDAIHFETSHVQTSVQKNVLTQLNKVSHDIAVRVGQALGLKAPAEDTTFYHNKTTRGISIFGEKLPIIATLRVGVLTFAAAKGSLAEAASLAGALNASKVSVKVVAETLAPGVNMTYSAAEAIGFDAIVVVNGAEMLFERETKSTLFPPGRPLQILTDAYHWGKPIGFLGSADKARKVAGPGDGPGVYVKQDVAALASKLKEGLATFKFTDRFATDDR